MDDEDLGQIEAELKKSEAIPKPEIVNKAVESAPIETVTDLQRLSSFSDISVLQKRYQPKTERFQFNAGFSYMTNDPWNMASGLNLKLAYGFTEAWAFEGLYYSMNSSAKEDVSLLNKNHNVDTSALIATKSIVGAQVVWTPMYGKISLLNRRIVPYDMYFSAGAGNATLAGGDSTSANSILAGTGQVFALTKGMGFRWDLLLNRFTAKTEGNQQTFNNLVLSLGFSFYFPEVSKR